MTVKSRPAITAVPVRWGPCVGATLTFTGPGPLAEVGVTLIQSTLLAAVQGQACAVATVRVVGPPDAAALCASRSIEYVHPSDCVTLKRCPAIVTDPVRGGPVVGATETVTVAFPRPLEPAVTSIHAESDDAVQVHS